MMQKIRHPQLAPETLEALEGWGGGPWNLTLSARPRTDDETWTDEWWTVGPRLFVIFSSCSRGTTAVGCWWLCYTPLPAHSLQQTHAGPNRGHDFLRYICQCLRKTWQTNPWVVSVFTIFRHTDIVYMQIHDSSRVCKPRLWSCMKKVKNKVYYIPYLF